MELEKFISLMRTLFDLTNSGKIDWHRRTEKVPTTSWLPVNSPDRERDDIFYASFQGAEIRLQSADMDGRPPVEMMILDEDGRQVEYIASANRVEGDDVDSGEGPALIVLYELIAGQHRQRVLDSLIADLARRQGEE